MFRASVQCLRSVADVMFVDEARVPIVRGFGCKCIGCGEVKAVVQVVLCNHLSLAVEPLSFLVEGFEAWWSVRVCGDVCLRYVRAC